MKKDKHKTAVKFLLDKGDNGVFAYFPEIEEGDKVFSCYSHVGQHSTAGVIYAGSCTPATPAQYADLKAELESIGYNLEVIN